MYAKVRLTTLNNCSKVMVPVLGGGEEGPLVMGHPIQGDNFKN